MARKTTTPAEPAADPIPGADAIAADPPLAGPAIADVDSNEERFGVAQALDGLGEALETAENAQLARMVDRIMVIVSDEANGNGFARGSLVGDIRDTLIDVLKIHGAWGKMAEADQKQLAGGIEDFSKELIARVTAIVVRDISGGHEIMAKLDSYAEKGGLKIQLSAEASTQTVIGLHKAHGKMVMIRPADTNDYNGQRREPAVEPDQPDLQFETSTKAPDDSADAAELAGSLDDADPQGQCHLFDPFEREWLAAGDAFTTDRGEALTFASVEAAKAEAADFDGTALQVVMVGAEPDAA